MFAHAPYRRPHDRFHGRWTAPTADLTCCPRKKAAGGSDDAEQQARILLEDSDARTEDPEGTKDESVQTPDETGV